MSVKNNCTNVLINLLIKENFIGNKFGKNQVDA